MEFSLGRRDRLYLFHQDQEEEKRRQQQHTQLLEFSKRPSPFSVPAVESSPSSSSIGIGWTRGDGGGDGCNNFVEKEHMFDKVVTPSDVGKLNRLVIPKHHAEKHFPLDAAANEKGLLLSFEDRAGKAWRFRYSYWNSSQSYVMTKGWSRFVKEKGLTAGDTVSFGRGVGEGARHRLFIDWRRRRPETTTMTAHEAAAARFTVSLPGPWSGRIFLPPPPPVACGYNWQGRAVPYGATAAVGGGQLLYYKLPAARPPEMVGVQQLGIPGIPIVRNSVPQAAQNQAAESKRVRLFGVNLDSPESSSGDAGLLHPRTTPPLPPLFHQPHAAAGSSSSSSSSSSASKEQQQHSPLHLYL